ncbi:uncharacterized protein PGRI_084680 [Penicillium griseofulvum]|uniref:Uncharacterized protein n=1 Tax=Penicillium patulum TaxID=5078 RepID=A0A135LT76_PENPA|nr:uncharacterized protein PGRI_084680 [Penicillium griseofulvum]KXG52184.1 hypothetical protein PGRI_084680 [Penicillium griseofulvum]
MFRPSMLLSIGTWAAVVLQATAVPHGPSYYNKLARDNNDPCGPVSQYTENRSPEKWNQANTDDWLNQWWTVNADKRTTHQDGFTGAFGEYALGQPGWSCQNNGNDANCEVQVRNNPELNGLGSDANFEVQPCGNPKLNSLGNNTEKAYYVLQAINNLHGFFLGLDQSFNIAAIVAALDNDEIVYNFWHDENNWDALAFKELLNAIAVVFAVAAVGISAPAMAPFVSASAPAAAAGFSTLLSGGTSAGILATGPKDTSGVTQAKLGHFMAETVKRVAGSFITTNDELMAGHSHETETGPIDIRSYLQGGAWVNYGGLKKTDAHDKMTTILQSLMINSLWRSQRVFIMGGGACGDGQDVGQGTNANDNVFCDEENRAWYLYYWQKDKNIMKESAKPVGWISRPWGSDRMGGEPILEQEGGAGPFWKNILPVDAIKSSLKSYQVAGYNYDSTAFSTRMADIFAAGSNAWNEGASMEGVWTIPVCDISATINNPDYSYEMKEYILQPYGFDRIPKWCGPICGMDKKKTAEFYKAANFINDMEKPFLRGCTIDQDRPNFVESGHYWDWTTDEEFPL